MYKVTMNERERRLALDLFSRVLCDPYMQGYDKELAEELFRKLAVAEEEEEI